MRLAWIDLSKGTSKIVERDELDEFIGGKGAATKLLLSTPKGIDPFHPDAVIIFAIGPLNGIRLPGASRMTAVFKSPLTFAYGESQCGGFAAVEMARSGIHLLAITGRAEKPVYIVVENEEIRIEDASHLWEKDCYETEDSLRKDEGGEVLAIGPAGENLVRFACITHRRGRQFGRCGAGAVMGAKRLKSIVLKGSKDIEVANEDSLDEFREWMQQNVVAKLESMRRFGTPVMASLLNEIGALPTEYWRRGRFEGLERIGAEELSKYTVRNSSCYACSVACGKIRRIGDVEVDGPEYETLFAFGPLCCIDDPAAIARANDLCDRLGMDTISAGNVIALYMSSGKAKFGDASAIELLEDIAFRRGIGDVLAEGARIAAKKLGCEAVHVRGLEPPGYDPRGIYAMALAYLTSQRGACHMRSCAYRPNIAGKLNRTSPLGQAKLVKELEDFYCVVDSLVFCRFLCLPEIGMGWEEVSKLLEIVTGKSYGVDVLRRIGERIWLMTYEYNEREGSKAELPETFFRATPENSLTPEALKVMLDEYRGLRDGRPRDEPC